MLASDNKGARPVALLAREGAARDRLRDAVAAAGGRVVLEDDPNTLDAAALESSGTEVVLVALEPAVEDALERLDTVLESPRYTLMFEEADIIAKREGWESQRWIRHLAAKLQGHDNVLPPGPEDDAALQPEPGMPVRPAELHVDAPLQFHLDEAQEAADTVPADGLYFAASEGRSPPPEVMSFEELMAKAQAEEIAAVTAVAESSGLPPPLPPLEVSPDGLGSTQGIASPAAAAGNYSSWSLLEDDAYVAPAAPSEAAAAENPSIASLLSSSLSLVELEPESDQAASGPVVVLAGIGGPDAVRRLLSGLPEEFSRPVLVQMRLDGGRYANLVKQMARVTALPVMLAVPGQPAETGNVYVLADGIGLEADGAVLRFVEASAQLIAALPADSAVVMLSGADPALVPDVMAFAAQGGWAAGQTGDGCYDPEAASQLVVAGLPGGDPEYLAGELATRCAQ